ncbi:MAG TPA: ABC transporter substrate-binding protein [Accumulibacter sp.]|uniref:ABC transporter substrate-binding protein n=1 Tax=Candidatus Accumulibacter cognatus TaxID=2954383 RepID=A0A080M3J7_9PROT|nr:MULTISPECIES: ABC transporter substrate-binding protein [Candidatus Accumulibacter]MCC2868555.1 ABC transporter substrate-binding protein [Candidatus Accumulibacter phosphatis]KFB74920.1 MAG: Leucine-, isoleucine-, valine-, threonine-, and alanine-binding protein precursor [Candidatus Accumulibacter cognatus]MBN8516879.1 ABC transporter substrate-binding protein [Accumulibacter sp.]MBO3710556.1 ABC transporter substrate-binding protein [Accumulibacter sp.]MCM8578248.1 ABC transporter substr
MPLISFVRATLAIILFALALPSAAQIVIGQIAAFSGPLAPTGTHMRAGAQLYFDAINAEGGIHGARIRLLSKDDGYKSEETVRLAREMLKESQPLAFIGFVGTGNVEAILDQKILSEAGIPLVAVRTGTESLVRRNDPFLFMTRASYAEEIEKITDQYITTGYTRFAILYQDDAFGQGVLQSAEQAIKNAGGTLAAKGAYAKNTTEVGAAVKIIAAANPQAVILIANTAASAEFLKQSREAGNLAQYVALSTTDAAQIVQRIGAEKAEGLALTQVVPDPNSQTVPLIREIQNNFAKFKPRDVTLNHTFVEGYLGAMVLGEALRRAGPNPTRKKLRDTLEALKSYDAGGVFISFSPKRHAGSRFVDITILNRAGKLLR